MICANYTESIYTNVRELTMMAQFRSINGIHLSADDDTTIVYLLQNSVSINVKEVGMGEGCS